MQAVLTVSAGAAVPAQQACARAQCNAMVTPSPSWRRQLLHRLANSRRHMTVSQAAAVVAEAPAAQLAAAAPAGATTALTYTSFEGNSFRVQFAKTGINVLVDPWLVGKLTLGGLDFIYAGSKRVARPETIDIDALAAETDLLVLSQGIDDHAHRPTLQRLPKTMPVVASAGGAAVAKSLGFRTVYTLGHNQSLTLLDGRLTIQGTAGALVGPPWSKRELGVVLRETGGASLYYEPHADYVPDSVSRVGPVDVVVSPPASQSLLGYALVKGSTDTLQLLKLLRPRAYIPLMNAEFEQAGPLASLLVEKGTAEEMAAQLRTQPDLSFVQVCVPQAAQPMPVQL